jgi:hypothetical protein
MPLSGSLVKSTHWTSRQRVPTRSARATAPCGAPAFGSLVRLFLWRAAPALPGERVESGMTVGFRLSARV